MLESQETRPLNSLPVRRAVTQPRWPRLMEPGRPRQTDTHLDPATLSEPLPRMLPRRPFPVLSHPFGLSHCPGLPASASGAVLSGPGGGGASARRPTPPPPPPHCRKCLPTGTSLTSQDSDVNGRVPVRACLGGGGREKQQRPSRGRRDIPARAVRRHLGSRLLTARAALSNSLQSRPPTPGPAPGPPTPGPSAPPCAAVRGADAAQEPPSGPPVQGPRGLLWALVPHTLVQPQPPPPPALLTSA